MSLEHVKFEEGVKAIPPSTRVKGEFWEWSRSRQKQNELDFQHSRRNWNCSRQILPYAYHHSGPVDPLRVGLLSFSSLTRQKIWFYLLHFKVFDAIIHAHVREVVLDHRKWSLVPDLSKCIVVSFAHKEDNEAEDEEAHEYTFKSVCLDVVHGVFLDDRLNCI